MVILRWSLASLAIVLLGWMYVDAAFRQGAVVNTTLENTDQAAYLEYAVGLRLNGASHIGS